MSGATRQLRAPGSIGRRGLVLAALPATLGLGGCVSLKLGADAPAHAYLALHDPGLDRVAGGVAARVDALLIQVQPGSALADTHSIAYSRRAHEYAFYQLASWTERPVRSLPRLLQRRIEARGVASATGLTGDPLRADWLLALAIDEFVHELHAEPGTGRIALTAELFDRRARARVAHRRFEAGAAAGRADSAAAAAALSQATSRAFDELVAWLEVELQRGVSMRRP